MFYDEAGRMIWSEDAEDNRTYYYYDTAGMNTKIVSPFGNGSTSAVKMYYDKNGNLTSQLTQSNAEGEAEAYDRADYAYNNMNRLTVATSYPTADAPQYTQYFYDVNGNTSHMVTGLTATISAVADAPDTSAVHTYAYDRFNRLTSQTNPLGGTESYTYDRSDNVAIWGRTFFWYYFIDNKIEIWYTLPKR